MKRHLLTAAAVLALLLGGAFLAHRLLRPSKPPSAPTAGGGAADAAPKQDAPQLPPGQVKLDTEQLKNGGVRLETAGPATIRSTLRLAGKVAANDDVLVNVAPRFPGIVRRVNVGLGDKVTADQVLATVESNESLRPYDLKAGLAGTVINKNVSPGQYVAPTDTLYVVNDLSTVFVDLNVYRQDFPRLHVKQKVLIDLGDGNPPVENDLDYLSPFGAENTQSLLARVVVPNPRGTLRPGLFVTAEVVLEENPVPVAVRAEALQTVDNKPSVFVRRTAGEGGDGGGVFEARPVQTGRRDGDHQEVTGGLRAGETYAGANSFVLKAELGKGALGGD